MITIPVAVAIPFFEKQISFFQYQHKEVYGEEAISKAYIPIIRYNHFNEASKFDVEWDMSLPYKMVGSVYDYVKSDKQWHIPINVFIAAKQLLDLFKDEQVVEIIDSDLVHLKPYPKVYDHLDYDVVLVDATYEDWHMHISKPESINRKVINQYLTHDEEGYINGGFNVIARVKTIKRIIDDIIIYSCSVTEKEKGNQHSWWCAMYGLNIACHNHKIKMIDIQNCYYPGINELKDSHYIAHYSCDPLFDKHKMNNLDASLFPNNLFYNQAKKWLGYTQQKKI